MIFETATKNNENSSVVRGQLSVAGDGEASGVMAGGETSVGARRGRRPAPNEELSVAGREAGGVRAGRLRSRE